MAKDYELGLLVGEFAKLLGFDKKVLKDGTNFTVERIPNIPRGIDWVFIHCDLITRRANDAPSDVLYSFSAVGLQVSFSVKKEPRGLKFHPVNKKRIDAVGIRIADGRSNILDLNEADAVVDLVIQEVSTSE